MSEYWGTYRFFIMKTVWWNSRTAEELMFGNHHLREADKTCLSTKPVP